ncbi:MAG: hypothetical protein HY321_11635 [Armatimonadetes bacterium]|nr:hypothetical protein [Armatimonadota bacterium]
MGKRILLFEGLDDLRVVSTLCESRGLPDVDEVKQYEGVHRLLESFPIRLKESDVEVLGVVLDADTSPAGRWEAIRKHLAEAGYPDVPERPTPTGTILPPPPASILPRTGIWIMPDNQTPGILEDFLRFLVPDGSPLFSHVCASVAAIPEGERRFSRVAEPKALIHTWLAWQEEPGKPLGLAVREGYFNVASARVDALASWLNRLFFP